MSKERVSRKERFRNAGTVEGGKTRSLKDVNWGLVILVLGALWAVVQFTRSILYFF